jgi:hypothetical protein
MLVGRFCSWLKLLDCSVVIMSSASAAAVHGYAVFFFVLGLSNELAFAFPCLHRNLMNILMRDVT